LSGWGQSFRSRYRRARDKILGRTVLSRRRYIPAALGVEGFFRELRKRETHYAVLRWFDSLPHLDPGEDIDMLVADADLASVADLFARDGIPCDLYSVSGLPGSSQRGMPYFPPEAAERLLSRAVELQGLYRVPCPEDYFLSLAYHAVYHKGVRSGLPTSISGLAPVSNPEHDYSGVLRTLAAGLGLPVAIDMESLDEHLGVSGWSPTPSMLKAIALRNAWAAARSDRPAPEGTLAVASSC